MTPREYIYSAMFLVAGLWIGHWWGWLRACRLRDRLEVRSQKALMSICTTLGAHMDLSICENLNA